MYQTGKLAHQKTDVQLTMTRTMDLEDLVLFNLSNVSIFRVHIPMFTYNAEHDMKTTLGTLKAITFNHLTFDWYFFGMTQKEV